MHYKKKSYGALYNLRLEESPLLMEGSSDLTCRIPSCISILYSLVFHGDNEIPPCEFT